MADVRVLGVEETAEAGRLLHDFNTEYDDVTPGPEALATRLSEVIGSGGTSVLVVQEEGAVLGLAVARFRPSLWSRADECYLAELYVVPSRRGAGLGTVLLTATVEHARERGADFIDLATSVDDLAACALYEKLGFSAHEGGPTGPLARHYERGL